MIMGNKVLIRRVEQEDLPEIHRWVNDIELKELFDFTIDFFSYEEIDRKLKEVSRGIDSVEFTVVEKETRKPVGMCFLTDIDHVNKRAFCNMYIGDGDSRHKGYGTEAMILLMKFAFEDLNLNRLSLWVFDFNKRAIKCYKRCGMKVEGIMREGVYRNGKYHDVYLMGILKQEYNDLSKGGSDECSEVNM